MKLLLVSILNLTLLSANVWAEPTECERLRNEFKRANRCKCEVGDSMRTNNPWTLSARWSLSIDGEPIDFNTEHYQFGPEKTPTPESVRANARKACLLEQKKYIQCYPLLRDQ